ncbi:MAG: hypothetical protein OXU61_10305 [Gammaproteobacteria bacterium]|nr:hypothetical protein [Gammaproteobacteria bacterium]
MARFRDFFCAMIAYVVVLPRLRRLSAGAADARLLAIFLLGNGGQLLSYNDLY